MKRYFCVLLFLLSAFISSAQLTTFERAIKPAFNAGFVKILAGTNGQWFLAGNLSSASPDRNYIMKCDSVGNTLWSDSGLDTNHIGYIGDLIKSADENLVACGVDYPCDGIDLGIFLKKVDTNGTLQWIRKFPIASLGGGPSGVSKVIQLSGNGFLFTSINILYKTDPAGFVIWTDTLTNGAVLCLLENQQHNYLVGTSSGISVFDSSGNFLSTHPIAGGAQEIISLQDTGYFVSSGTDFNDIDTAFTSILTFNLSGYLSSVQQIKYYGNEWWILGRENNQTTVLNLDSLLQYSNSFSFGDDHVIGGDLDISSTRIALAGVEITAANSNMFVKTFLKNGTSVSYHTDAGITDIRYDTVYMVHHIALPPGVSDLFFDTYVTVKNFGQDTLTDVFVNSKFFTYTICEYNFYMHQFTGLNLLPNDTVQLHLGLLWDPMLYCANVCTFDYCFWTSCPNGKVDKDHSNDSICNGFTADFQTGLQVQKVDNGISVFPNPAESEIFIQLAEEKNQHLLFEIKNLLGEKILSGELAEKINTIDLATLPPGIYFICIHSGEKAVTRKFIKL